jgi:hypothetical protein
MRCHYAAEHASAAPFLAFRPTVPRAPSAISFFFFFQVLFGTSLDEGREILLEAPLFLSGRVFTIEALFFLFWLWVFLRRRKTVEGESRPHSLPLPLPLFPILRVHHFS